MKNSNYLILKGSFIFFFMMTIFFLLDITEGLYHGRKTTVVTHMDANVSVLFIFLLLFSITIAVLFTIWSIKHSTPESTIYVVVNDRNTEIVYVGISEEDCKKHLPDKNHSIIPFELYDIYVNKIRERKGGEKCCQH